MIYPFAHTTMGAPTQFSLGRADTEVPVGGLFVGLLINGSFNVDIAGLLESGGSRLIGGIWARSIPDCKLPSSRLTGRMTFSAITRTTAATAELCK
eukprot:SAG31_NODE_384_length_16414_cov_7.492308_13_plen_96_part_00